MPRSTPCLMKTGQGNLNVTPFSGGELDSAELMPGEKEALRSSLEMIVGLESNSKIFTVSVHGLLELQAGQYTSIFVDNAAGASITIQNGSDFMGMLLGV